MPNVWYPMHSPISIENRYTWLMRSVLNNEAVNIQYVGGEGEELQLREDIYAGKSTVKF